MFHVNELPAPFRFLVVVWLTVATIFGSVPLVAVAQNTPWRFVESNGHRQRIFTGGKAQPSRSATAHQKHDRLPLSQVPRPDDGPVVSLPGGLPPVVEQQPTQSPVSKTELKVDFGEGLRTRVDVRVSGGITVTHRGAVNLQSNELNVKMVAPALTKAVNELFSPSVFADFQQQFFNRLVETLTEPEQRSGATLLLELPNRENAPTESDSTVPQPGDGAVRHADDPLPATIATSLPDMLGAEIPVALYSQPQDESDPVADTSASDVKVPAASDDKSNDHAKQDTNEVRIQLDDEALTNALFRAIPQFRQIVKDNKDAVEKRDEALEKQKKTNDELVKQVSALVKEVEQHKIDTEAKLVVRGYRDTLIKIYMVATWTLLIASIVFMLWWVFVQFWESNRMRFLGLGRGFEPSQKKHLRYLVFSLILFSASLLTANQVSRMAESKAYLPGLSDDTKNAPADEQGKT